MLAGLMNLGFAGGGAAAPAVVAETFTGGFNAWQQFRDEREIRRQRIARGIIPDDEPQRETIISLAAEPFPQLAKKRLREIAESEYRLEQLERLLADVLVAQRIAEEQAYQALLDELRQTEAQQQIFIRNENAMAVLVMLGLL